MPPNASLDSDENRPAMFGFGTVKLESVSQEVPCPLPSHYFQMRYRVLARRAGLVLVGSQKRWDVLVARI